MIAFVVRKLALSVVVLFVVSLGVAALTALIPGSPAALILGDTTAPGAMARFNHEYGYDKPFLERYWIWVQDAFHGDFGSSIQSRQSVIHILVSHIAVTLQLALMAMAVALLISVPLAMYCGAREGGRVDRFVTGASSALLSLPSFVAAVFIAQLFAGQLKLFPNYGWTPINHGLGENLSHAVMPVITMSCAITALFLRVLRADVVSMLREDFVLSARAKGLPDWYILLRHVLRPACISLFTITGLVFGFLLGGSIIVETYFSLPGIGQVVAQAVTGKDLPVVQGVVVVVAIIFLVLNTLVDVGYALIDPQVAAKR